MQIIIFDLNGQHYAIKTEEVEEISKLLEVTSVPNAPRHIKGLVNLRGNVISLMELSKLLGINDEEAEHYKNIVIVNVEKEMVGLLVGEVNEVIDIEEEKIEKVGIGEESKGIKGVIQLKDKLINFLNLEECIAQ